MRFPIGATLGAFVLSAGAVALATGPSAAAVESSARAIAWTDVAPIRARLERHGITESSFGARVAQIRRRNAERVREGDLDHLIFYLLQSTRFTTLPPIEPALSAKAFTGTGRVPDEVRVRALAFEKALNSSSGDARLRYFRDLVAASFPNPRQRHDALLREYARAMRFLYEKEFVAQRSERAADAIAELYRKRGLSTDTAIEAGFLVYQGLGVLKSLEPTRQIRRVLIVGPGLDLAPRTGLLEAGPPESYQPWAVMDALLALGLSQAEDLVVIGADINPRVVEHLRRARANPPVLEMTVGVQGDAIQFSDDYRAYFWNLGSTIGTGRAGGAGSRNYTSLHNRVQVRADAARLLHAQRLDIVTERLDGEPFDLVVATNILPYFDDVELMLAIANVASMLRTGGVLLHNEPRPLLGEITSDVGLTFDQLRQAVIATVEGAPRPLSDVVFVHRKAGSSQVPAPRLEAGSW
jgi:hypothetical protein